MRTPELLSTRLASLTMHDTEGDICIKVHEKLDHWAIFILGGPNIGKVSFMVKAVSGYFCRGKQYDTTVNELYRKRTTIDDVLTILDLTADFALQAIPEKHITCETSVKDLMRLMRRFSIFILMYDTTSRESFQQVEFYHRMVMESKAIDNRFHDGREIPKPLYWLIASKADLEIWRQVRKSEGEALASRLENCMGFSECSCEVGQREGPIEALAAYVRALRLARAMNRLTCMSFDSRLCQGLQ
ncbi:hypothetical protein B0H34DRAFT_517289 [Crassisporium funariophilum]|nr:hypothetical protein B0H34DRAFT_517289 [Crassisporium funariophilum]